MLNLSKSTLSLFEEVNWVSAIAKVPSAMFELLGIFKSSNANKNKCKDVTHHSKHDFHVVRWEADNDYHMAFKMHECKMLLVVMEFEGAMQDWGTIRL